VTGHEKAQRAVLSAELLDHHRVGQMPQPRTAVLARYHQSQSAQVAELLEELRRHRLLFVPLADVRANLLGGKAAYHVA